MNKKAVIEKTPTSSDFTPQAVNKALFEYATNHWSLRYAIPLLLGTGLFGLLFGYSYILFLLILGIIGLTGIGFINNIYFKADKFKNNYTRDLLQKLEMLTEKKLKDLQKNLKEYKNNHGAKQLEQLRQKFDILNDILKSKFDVSQLTFDRYYSIAREVYLSGLDNLNDVVIAEKTLRSIDLDYIDERLKELGKENTDNMAIVKEKEALNRSKDSFSMQKQKIGKLLAENETALSQMDTATIAISEITKSKDKQGQVDMENSMKALSEMVERSKMYSR